MARREFITDTTVAAGTYRRQAPGGWSRHGGTAAAVAVA
jgi:hypothetical protein